MAEPGKGWSSTAPREEFKPFIAAEKAPAEFTFKAILFGALFGIFFGAVTVYVGLRAGLTVSASIPIAVLSISPICRKKGASSGLPASSVEKDLVNHLLPDLGIPPVIVHRRNLVDLHGNDWLLAPVSVFTRERPEMRRRCKRAEPCPLVAPIGKILQEPRQELIEDRSPFRIE